MPNRPGFFQIDAALAGLGSGRTSRGRVRRCRRPRPAAWRRRLAPRGVEGLAPERRCTARRRRARRACRRRCRPTAGPAGCERPIQSAMRVAPGRERAAPLRVLRHHAALAIGHADLVQDVGDVAAELRRTSGPPRRPARLRRRPAHCPGPSPAGSRRGRPSPAPRPHRGTAARRGRRSRMRGSAITAAWRVSAPSSREITAAISRPARLPPAARPRPAAASPRRRASAWTSAACVDLVAERDRLAGAQPQQVARRQRADHAPVSSTTPRWRTLSRLMRPMAR